MRLLLTGTGTDVGKTWVGARLATVLRATAWKPVQSFASTDDPTDAEILAVATGQQAHEVCPPHRNFPVLLAPPEAADELRLPPFTIDDLMAEMPAYDGVLLVEGAGGPRSPMASDGDTVAFAEALRPDVVVLVAPAGIGAINDVRLSVGALAAWPVIVFLNHFDSDDVACLRNAAFLRRDGFEVATDLPTLERLLHVRV